VWSCHNYVVVNVLDSAICVGLVARSFASARALRQQTSTLLRGA